MLIKFPGEVAAPYKPEELSIPAGTGVSSVDQVAKTGDMSGINISDYLPTTHATDTATHGVAEVAGIADITTYLEGIIVNNGDVVTDGGDVTWLV